MELKLVTGEHVAADLRMRFGAVSTAEGYSRIFLARLCRYAAGLLCPIDMRSLRKAILEPLEAAGLSNSQDEITEVLETLISQGDLLELEEITPDDPGRKHGILLYTAPPHFVRLSETRLLLLGIAPDDAPVLPEEMERQVQYVDCLRVLKPSETADFEIQLEELGVYRVQAETWLRAPRAKLPEQYREDADRRLDRAGRAGEILGLTVIDPNRPTAFYKGRWTGPEHKTGRFVGRRTRRYGGSLWCYVQLENGRAVRLIDLPMGHTDERGCDQAWRLQAAIDRVNGQPQSLRIRALDAGHMTMEVFSPIPKWLVRRWDSVGKRLEPKGCLISYSVDASDVNAEIQFAEERMWVETIRDSLDQETGA